MKGCIVGRQVYPVAEAQRELEAYPEVWNELNWRTSHPRSPHREVDDIWVRYNALANLKAGVEAFNGPHVSEWYPVAQKLPAIVELSNQVMLDHGYASMGGVLITRVPAGKQVYPHADQGWHATHYEKLCVHLQGDEAQKFCFEDLELATNEGDVFWFDNSFTHWVRNDTARDRVSLIVCVRR
jgi:hypothetical protein